MLWSACPRVVFSQSSLPLTDYLELVDYTGRAIVPNKRGAIPINTPPILQRLCLDRKTWLEGAINFEKHYRSRFLYQSSGFQDTG